MKVKYLARRLRVQSRRWQRQYRTAATPAPAFSERWHSLRYRRLAPAIKAAVLERSQDSGDSF